jgi:hypothetical protein
MVENKLDHPRTHAPGGKSIIKADSGGENAVVKRWDPATGQAKKL